MIFFHLPVFILLMLNIFGFLFVLLQMIQARRRTRSCKRYEIDQTEESVRDRANQETKEQMVRGNQ